MTEIEWVRVTGWANREIGAVGFKGNEAVVIAAFFDDRDGNKDGKVSLGEKTAALLFPIRISGMAVTQVARQAAADPDIIGRDANIGQMANELFMKFATRAVSDGIYAAYFSRAVGAGAGAIANTVVRGKVKQFVVKKTAESAVKKIFQEAVGL